MSKAYDVSVLGLAGMAGAGKDYTYSRLAEALQDVRPVYRVSFADELRYELDALLNLPRGNSAFWSKPYPEPVRWILQHYGTDYRRAQDPDYWVHLAMAHAEDVLDTEPDALIVVTDVRFENEAEAIRDMPGGVVAEVVAADPVRIARIGTLPPAHASEVIDFEPDYRIDNNGARPRIPGLLAYGLGLIDQLETHAI